MTVMMKCGHAANAVNTKTGKPSCVICIGITPGAEIVEDKVINLDGRMSGCTYCKQTVPSNVSLPFFEHRPSMEFDAHYCGCRGWD